jgi:hypothetical protein
MSTATVTTQNTGLVRIALKLDAVVTGANGAAYLALGSVLDEPLGISASVLHPVGAFLLLFAAAVWSVATRPTVSRTAVMTIVAANAVWALDSVLSAALDWGTPSTLGTVWIVLQAAVVAGFAAFQAYAVR